MLWLPPGAEQGRRAACGTCLIQLERQITAGITLAHQEQHGFLSAFDDQLLDLVRVTDRNPVHFLDQIAAAQTGTSRRGTALNRADENTALPFVAELSGQFRSQFLQRQTDLWKSVRRYGMPLIVALHRTDNDVDFLALAITLNQQDHLGSGTGQGYLIAKGGNLVDRLSIHLQDDVTLLKPGLLRRRVVLDLGYKYSGTLLDTERVSQFLGQILDDHTEASAGDCTMTDQLLTDIPGHVDRNREADPHVAPRCG